MTDSDNTRRTDVGILGAFRSGGRAMVETYRHGGHMVVMAPLILAIAVVPEFLQHIGEIHLGMFDSVDRFRARWWPRSVVLDLRRNARARVDTVRDAFSSWSNRSSGSTLGGLRRR